MSYTPYEEDTEFNLKMQPSADEIYRHIWPFCGIERDLGPLDKDRGIDVILTSLTGLKISFQEKFRRNKYLRYQQFTIEFKNNPETDELGELFKLAANYYFYAYANPKETCFCQWKIVDLNKFKEAYENGELIPDEIGQNKKRSRANFLCFDWVKLKNGLIKFSS